MTKWLRTVGQKRAIVMCGMYSMDLSQKRKYDNPEALKSVLVGLEDAEADRVQKLTLDEL